MPPDLHDDTPCRETMAPGCKVIRLDARRKLEDQFAVLVRRAVCDLPERPNGPGSGPRPKDRLDSLLLQGPARNWAEAAPRLRYLIEHFAMTLPGQETRAQKLIRRALHDIDALLRRPGDGP